MGNLVYREDKNLNFLKPEFDRKKRERRLKEESSTFFLYFFISLDYFLGGHGVSFSIN